MRLLQLLLTSIFIFIRVEYYYAYFDENGNNESSTEFSIESSTEDNLYLPDIVPEHYKIQLELAAEEDMFYGTSEVNITIKNATSLIYSHSELNITNVTLIEHNTTNETNKHIIQSYKYIKKMEIIVFYFDYELTPGKYMLNMAFTSIINNNIGGFFKTSYRNDTGDLKWLIATRTWTMGARRMFPCWDEPKFQAKFTITIEHHAKYTALSNMPISTSETINDTAITSFNTTPAISTHLIVIVLCDLTISTENINWRGRKQSISDQSFASFIATAFTLYFETKWKELQNFSNVQHVAIPGLLDDGMAKWAFISYREEDIICNEELDYYPAAQHIKVVSLIGRKISRQWLSTVVSPSSWSYMWLNEGIATFFYIEDVVKKTSGSSWSDLFAIQTMQESLHLDVLSIMSPLISKTDQFSDINSIFSLSYYVKAPFIMRMLQRILGDKVFRNGINTYFKRQSASLNDFWADMQTAYEEELPEILLTLPINIKKVMDPWIEQKSFPVLLVQVGDRYINIINDGDWMVPLTNTTQEYLDFNDTPTIKWLNSGKNFHMLIGSKLSLKNTWFIFNIQQTGYYRVNYNNENWLKIARYLKSENYKKIHVLNRAQIIDDAFHLMITNNLKSDIFWDLANYLSQETDYIAWYPMFKAMEYISYLFPFSENKQLKIKVLNQLRPVLRKIGYEEYSEDNDFTKCLRQEAAKWACVLGDPKCKTEAVTKLKWHLEKPKNNKLLPSWTYCNGLAVADVVTLHLYMQDTFIYEKNTKMFEFLACSDEPLIILRMFILDMKSKLNNGYSLINKNHIDLFHYIVMRHARNNTILDNIFNSWDFFKPKEISTITALIGIINNVYSEKQLDKIMTFVKNIKEILLTIIVHPLIRNSLESRTQNCTEHAKMIRDKIIQFQICSIQTKFLVINLANRK
ncbi:aminopeptidase N-like isoform X2 [Temnothorax nylanderi]|uniref:aminopeptidase N-like isoform X2 n=1 Tax=Temnothorax nylanderi TaxID=102681 RepID=UPI003A8C0336